MRPTIIHVEDDPYLGALVHAAFQRFGFGGFMIREGTLREGMAAAERCRCNRMGPHLIIVDMHLPDGTGLDLLQQVRRSPKLSSTPVLVLSGDGDPETVGMAYALGANSYVSKTDGDTSIMESLESLYDFWLTKAALPETDATPLDLLQQGIDLRRRVADIYGLLTRRFAAADPALARFWLNMFLSESNSANLLVFFRGQLDDRDLSPDQLAGIRDMQDRRIARVEQVRASLARKPMPTAQEALGFAAAIAVDFAETNLLAILDLLYSKGPVMAEALCELMCAHWASLADRFEQEEDCPELVRVAVELRHRLDVIAAHASFPSR